MTAEPEAPWPGKWDAYDAARGTTRPEAKRGRRGKAWLLPWLWIASTGMLILGGILIVLRIAGVGPWPGP